MIYTWFYEMTAIPPESEALRRAVRWLSAQRRYTADAIAEASRRFDLSPADEDFLLRTFLHADAGARKPADSDQHT